MTNESIKQTDLKRLEDVLDTYGALPERWPDDEREMLLRFVGTDARAEKLMGDARRFEAVLALAPAGHAGAALERRIVAAALDDSEREARIVPIEAGRRPGRIDALPKSLGVSWPAAVLAASFFLGLYVGSSEIVPGVVADSLRLANLTETLDESDDLFGSSVDLSGDREGVL